MIPCIPQLDSWTARRSPVTTAVNETAIQYQTQCGTNFPNLWGKFDSFITDYYEWRASSQLAIYTPDGPAVELMPDGNITGWDRSFAGPDGYCGYSYIKRLPADPWGNDYVLVNPGEHGAYDLLSAGPDGEMGTEDDITNWGLSKKKKLELLPTLRMAIKTFCS